MLNHLADKADGERRLEYINLIKPTLENPLFITQETINGAQRFRFFKTFIDEKDKVIKFLNVVEDKNGELLEITATPIKNTDLKNLLKGKIIWGGDALSDLSSPRTAKRGSETDVTIIPQKGNLINEEAKNNALPNSVFGIGDNASRTRERQRESEEILRQSGRNTSNTSQTKRTAKSDRQMEQRPAFKTDGDTDATAASKQVVEKQGSDARAHGEFMIRLVKSHVHKDFANEKAYFDHTAKHGGDDFARFNMNKLKEERTEIEQAFNITPIKDFGTNYAEFYHDAIGAVNKLLAEKRGQVAGAFYRKELGDIDLVWGNEQIGLNKILSKHEGDFKEFGGVANGLKKIIDDGKLISENGINTIWLKKGDEYFLTGLSKGFLGNGKNNWIVTSYKKTKGKIPNEVKGDVANLSAYSDEFKGELTSSHPPFSNKDIISKKGNLINEKAKNNALSNGVFGIGDNASRARGRQRESEEILRQSGRNTSNTSQTKRTAKSDRQMEQRSAFKTDGDTDATASSKQMVEKQGSDARAHGELRANSNAHIGSGLVAGTLNSIDEDGNFNPEKFAAGFLAGLVGSKAVAIAARKMTPQLYNKILGVAKKMPQMAKDNPKLLGKLYKNAKDVSLNSFAGEKAITANVGKLDQAKAMLEKGANEVEIWQKTGWFKDRDGAWKFEIGDSKAKLNPNFKSGGKLGELLEHEELFKAYPELKDVRVVKIGDDVPEGAAFSVKDTAQREKRGIYNVAFNNKKSTIIRKDLETIDEIIKFEKGEADYVANGERKSGYGALHIKKHLEAQNNGWVSKQEYLNMGQMLRKSTMQEVDNKRIYTYFNDEGIRFRVVVAIGKNKERVISFYSNRKPLKAGLSYNSQNYDGNLPLNDDIVAQNGTKGYYSPANNEIGLSDLSDKSALMHEVQHAIQEIEGFAGGGSRKRIESSLWYESGRLAYDLKKLAPPPEFYVLEKKRSTLSSKLMLEADKIIEQNPLMEDNIIENTFNKKNFDKLKLRNTKELKEFKDVLTKYHETDNALDDMVKNHPIFKERKKISDKLDALVKKDPYEEYKKLHGEAEARNVQNRLNFGGKKHPHETFDVNPDETIVGKEDGINLSHELEKKYILKDGSINEAAVRKEAEPFIEKEYSLENFKAEFPNGKVDTPIGEVAVSNYQFEKLNFKGREKYLGLIKPTLERPAFVVDFEDTTFFFKPFRDKDGVIKFASVIKERDGGLDVTSNYPMANRKFELIAREGKVRYVQGSVAKPVEHSLDNNVRSSGGLKPIEHSSDGKGIIPQNEEKVYHSRNIEEIKQEHPNVEKELDESIAAMRKESFNDVNFKDNLISKINAKDITTKQLGKSVNLSDKQLAVLKNDIKNADFKVISDSKIYFDKMGKDGDKKRFFIDIAEDGNLRVDAYAKSQIDNIPIKENALQELAGVGDRARLKNMSFEVKAAYHNELDPIKKEAILKTAELNKLKKAAQSGDKMAMAKFEEFKAKNLDKDGNIKDGLRLC